MRNPAGTSDMLIGRHDAKQRIEELTTSARAGRGGALVLTGEAGIGKSALIDHAGRATPGVHVINVSGSEFEQELPYSALHHFCLPIMDRLSALPGQHQDALRVAFGLSDGTPNPFQLGMATLGLVTAAARTRPLLCLIDDAQWLDDASSKALLFLARRLATDPVAALFAVRSPSPAADRFDALPGLTVDRLSDDEARTLLETRSRLPLDDQVRDRLIIEAQGNPLALLELPRAGGFVPPGMSPVPSRVARGFEDRLTGLSAEARLLLTVASTDPTGDPALLWPAADRLGPGIAAARTEAASTRLAEFGTHIRFCHPLARSAVYRAARDDERRRAHQVLAEVTDPVKAPDRRAWHRAHAIVGPDDDVAAELERSASRASARGGVAAAAAFLERSVVLSQDGPLRIVRTLAAAEAHLTAGTTDAAAQLLATIETAALDELQRAQVDLLRGRIAFTRPDDRSATMLMVRVAQRLSRLHPERARESFVDAIEMSLMVAAGGQALREIVDAARSAAPPATAPDALTAMLVLDERGAGAAAPLLHRVLHAPGEPLWVRRPALATMLAIELWDIDTHALIADGVADAGRRSGSPLALRLGLTQQAVDAMVKGDIGRAIALTAEEEAIADAAGSPPLIHHRLQLAAMRGRREEFLEIADEARARHHGGGLIANLNWTSAILHNGLGDHRAALAAASHVTAEGADPFLVGVTLPELVEAAIRCREPAAAARALAALTDRTEDSGISDGLGVAAYARGLVTGVEDHYRESVELLGKTTLVPYLGRAHLLYGEWLAAQGRRQEASAQLHTAHELLSRSGAEAFARRAADGLAAAGYRARPAAGQPLARLTMQEVAVARAVATGATSAEVAAQLFLSKRTVDAHLRSIFRKLGVTSRRQLRTYPGLVT